MIATHECQKQLLLQY